MLHGSQLSFSRSPTPPPLANGGQATIKRLRQLHVALVRSGSQHDPCAEREGLRTTGLTQQCFKQRLLWDRKGNRLWLRASHANGTFYVVEKGAGGNPQPEGYHNLKRISAKLY